MVTDYELSCYEGSIVRAAVGGAVQEAQVTTQNVHLSSAFSSFWLLILAKMHLQFCMVLSGSLH